MVSTHALGYCNYYCYYYYYYCYYNHTHYHSHYYIIFYLLQSTENDSFKADPWSNTLTDLKGSYSLHFDPVLDDVTVLDGRIIEKICKKAIIVIHYKQKWETLIDIILRFNALTNEKFAEFTFPLLINAQHHLELKCNSENVSVAANLEQLVENPDGSLNTKKYLNLQLKVSTAKPEPVPLGAYLDARSYTSNKAKGEASSLISVPINVDSSWKYIQSVLEESDYTMRAVYHSRQLLHLYIAGRFYSQCSRLTGEEIEMRCPFLFLENILEPLPSPDLHLNFDSPTDTISCFNANNLSDTVITSYSQAIELLLHKNEKELAAQMLSEMGHVQLISGDRKAAFQSWNSSLELILRLNKKSASNWRSVYQDDIDAHLLKTCGIWGCLLGGTVAVFIARYCIVTDTSHQLEFCFLAYHLYKAIFCGSLQHPTVDVKFAMYNVGDNFLTRDVISDAHLFSDHYRCPSRQLIFALQSVIETLYINGYYLKMLPLLTLLLYLTRRLFHDTKLYVQGQIFRLQALTNLHMFTEATLVFQQLITGYHLPLASLSTARLIEPRAEHLVFDSSSNLTDPGNLKVLHLILSKYLTNQLLVSYGPQVSSELNLAIIRLLITLAECINVIPDEDESFATLIKNVHGHDIDNGDMNQNIFTAIDGPATLEQIKGLLLFVANHRLEILLTDLQSKTDNKIKSFPAFHIDMKIKCALERSRIYQQKHMFYFAAKLCCETMNHMQQLKLPDLPVIPSSLRSSKSQENTTESSAPEAKPNILHNTIDVEHLSKIGSSLWLQCRLQLVKSMNSFVPLEEHCKEFGEPLLPELASVMQYCQEGQQEAKICNDFEKEADFIYMEVLDQFKTTHCTKTCNDICQKGISVIQQCSELSSTGLQTMVRLLMLQIDLQIKTNEPLSVFTAQYALNVYVKVKELVENKLQTLCPNFQAKKLKNVYLPFLDILADSDLRVALMSVKYSQHTDVNDLTSVESKQRNKIFNSLELLNEALLLNRSSNSYRPSLSMEILLQTGKVQRLLCRSIPSIIPISSFIEAIKVDYSAHHNIVLTKSAYLEISLVCFSYLKEPTIFQCQRTKLKTGKNEYENRIVLLQPQKERYLAMLAWLAIRTTAILSNKHMQEISLRGSLKLASQADISSKLLSKIPDFINMDIFAKYVLGKKRIKFESEFDKEYAEMMKNQPQKFESTESEEEQMKKIKAISSSKISWMHIFSYLVSLSDELYQTIVSANETFQEDTSESDEAPESFYKTFMYSMPLDQSIRLQYTNTYSFLSNNFSLFTRHCSTINIPAEVEELAITLNHVLEEDQNIISESLKALNLENCSAKGLLQDSPSVNQKPTSMFPWSMTYPKSEEVCFQWYSPLFESLSQKNLPDHSESNNMHLLCSMTKKVKQDEYQCYTNNFILPRKFAVDLYKRIKKAIHMKEIAEKPLNSKPRKPVLHSRKSFGSFSSDAETQDYQRHVLSILQEIQKLFAPTSRYSISQMPFEETNLNHLLELFNVNVGSHLITGELAVWLTNLVFSEKT
ncbi:cilia- and flagella-associated protein 54-like [Octopus bimaculoides]|nr:cilia- and flagella-associated protein 54-like [Octopus bimaculoides]